MNPSALRRIDQSRSRIFPASASLPGAKWSVIRRMYSSWSGRCSGNAAPAKVHSPIISPFTQTMSAYGTLPISSANAKVV